MRKKNLFIDLSNIGNITYYKISKYEDVPKDPTEKLKFYSRALMINILGASKEFNPDNIIVACEDYCWRKDYFPEYKANRNKEERDPIIKKMIDYTANFLDNYTHCKVIKANGAEGDDVIAIAIEESKDDENIIYSNDKDFNQLLKFENTYIYDPRKRVLKSSYDGFEIFLKYFRGDNGDNIPNISNRARETTIKEYYESSERFKIHLGENKEFNELFNRNKKLISLSSEYIPGNVADLIREYLNKEKFVPKNQEKADLMKNASSPLLRDIVNHL